MGQLQRFWAAPVNDGSWHLTANKFAREYTALGELAEGEELGSNLLRIAKSGLWVRAVPLEVHDPGQNGRRLKESQTAVPGDRPARWCGHLSHPLDDCSESDDGVVISGGLFETGCDAAELLEF